MIRQRLLDWQWSDYSAKHRSRTNLLLHIVAVPLFQVGSVVLVGTAIARSGVGMAWESSAWWVGSSSRGGATAARARRPCRSTEPPTPSAASWWSSG
jgi:hypothetical protein